MLKKGKSETSTQNVLKCREELCATLTEDQKILLEKYERMCDDNDGLIEQKSFIKGMKFGIRIMLEEIMAD